MVASISKALLLFFSSFLLYCIRADALAQRRPLPEKVLVGYSSHCGDGSVPQAVQQGANVIIWAFANFASSLDLNDETSTSLRARRKLGAPIIHSNLDLSCIRKEMEQLDEDGFDDVVHLVSFGGWNGPHLDTRYSSKELYDAWKDFGADLFHGIDWDLEGSDVLDSPRNFFDRETLDRMGQFSDLAKKDGYIVTIAPPQSYLDISTTHFSRYVNLTSFDQKWHPEFSYMGKNVYAYLLALYGRSIDLVHVQFYESYSRAAYSVLNLGVHASTYIENYATDLALRDQMFYVDFEEDPELNMRSGLVKLPLSKLVIGLANGWADGQKSLFIDPADIQIAYEALSHSGHTPRGFMFWTIDQEGRNGVNMAKGLNEALHIR